MIEAILNSTPLFTIFLLSLAIPLIYVFLALGRCLIVATEERALEEHGRMQELKEFRRTKKTARNIFGLGLLRPK